MADLTFQLAWETAGGLIVRPIELASSAGSVNYAIEANGLKAGAPPRKRATASGAFSEGADIVAEVADNSTLSVPLAVYGTDGTTLQANWDALEAYSRAVVAFHDDERRGDHPVLYENWTQGTPRIWDLHAVVLEPPGAFRAPLVTGYTARGCTLSLIVRPYGRGLPIDIPAGSTLSNNNSSVITTPPIPGTAPALCRLVVTDSSTSGVINRVRWGYAAASGLPSDGSLLSDINWFRSFSAPASQPAASGTWSTVSDGDELNGNAIRFAPATGTWDWTTVATLSVTSKVGAATGTYIPFVRVRDLSAIAPPTLYRAAIVYGGSLAYSTSYTYAVTATNASGETVASNYSTVTTRASGSFRAVSLTWRQVQGATGYKVYRSTNAGSTWAGYFTVSSGSTLSYIDSGATPTAGSPPTTSSANVGTPLTEFKLLVGLPGDTSDNLQTLGTAFTVVGGGSFELVEFSPWSFPPVRLPSGYTSPGWQVQLQARRVSSATGGSAVVDIDDLLLLPLASNGFAEYPTLQYATKRTWAIEHHRDDTLSATLTDGSNSAQAAVTCDGTLLLEPNTQTQIFVTAAQAGGVHSVANARFTVAARITPRYQTLVS